MSANTQPSERDKNPKVPDLKLLKGGKDDLSLPTGPDLTPLQKRVRARATETFVNKTTAASTEELVDILEPLPKKRAEYGDQEPDDEQPLVANG